MTAKWTVLAFLAAAPVFSQNTINLTYDGYDSAHSVPNPGFICSPVKQATVTPTATGFSFPVNWSCWSGDATVTGSVALAFSPATVTATKTGTWDTLNFSPPVIMTATANISGTGAAGYWVALTSTGEVAIRGLSPNAVIATAGSPASFDATRFHTLEMVAQGSSLAVYLDSTRLTFTRNNASVTTVELPATSGSNDGTVGIAFADEANRGKAGGQRAQNLIVAQPGGTPK
jgi:hypothetical protein